MIRPTPIFTGKPTARMFSWGTVLTITPMALLTISRIRTTGAATRRPMLNNWPNSLANSQAPAGALIAANGGTITQDWNMAWIRM